MVEVIAASGFLPLIVKAHGLSNVSTGLVTAAPYAVGACGMLLVASSSDRWNERRWHIVACSAAAAAGLVVAAASDDLTHVIPAMAIAATGDVRAYGVLLARAVDLSVGDRGGRRNRAGCGEIVRAATRWR